MSATHYDPKNIEETYYPIWEERGYFEIDGNKSITKPDKHFAIMMPPPNVTGRLHIGHGLTFTLQDIIVRYKRMDGYMTLWQPGTDHAGIATQNVVEKQLLAEGKTKEELGREAFLERVWEWKEESGGIMVGQLRKLGVSPAWSRERFTMDEGLKSSVKEAFVHLYNQNLIVRGNYMVNWCTHDGALSDIEVEHEEHQGNFYHMRYPFSDGSGHIVVATTRPETYFGDTAIMVHPDHQYNPKAIQALVEPIVFNEADAVFGSRMMIKGNALKGGMPIWKYISNIFLTKLENMVLKLGLTEYHSGFRAYSKKTLETLPLENNSNDFLFDMEIIVQLKEAHLRVREISIPTHYFSEASVMGVGQSIKYGCSVLLVLFKYILYKIHLASGSGYLNNK